MKLATPVVKPTAPAPAPKAEPEPAEPYSGTGALAHLAASTAPAYTRALLRQPALASPARDAHTVGIAQRGVDGAEAPLPHADRIQASFGAHDVTGVRTAVGGVGGAAAEWLGAHAYTLGDRVAFCGPPDLRTASHEAAHVVQQRVGVDLPGGVGRAGDAHEQRADAVADAVVEGRSAEPLLDVMPRGDARAGVQRAPLPPAETCPMPAAITKVYGAQITDEDLVAQLTGTDGTYFAGVVLEHLHLFDGLRGFECACPKAFEQLRHQVDVVVGRTAFDWAYTHDAELLTLARNSARLQQYANELGAWYEASKGVSMTAGAATAYRLAEDYAFDYLLALDGFARGGPGVLLGWHLIYDDVKAAGLFVDEETSAAQVADDERAALAAERKARGLAIVGSTVATRENLVFDDDVSLEALATPEDGVADWNLAVAWARQIGAASAIVEIGDRYYLYTVTENLAYEDVWESESFEEQRSALVPAGANRTRALITSDGYVLTVTDGQRFFGGYQSRSASEDLLADLELAEEHGGEVAALPMVRQIALDMLMLRLADAATGLRRARQRIHPSWGMNTADEGRALQDRVEELRRHVVQAAQLAYDAADPPTDDQREAMQDELEEIGRLSADDPVAATMVKNRRGQDDKTRPEDDEYTSRLAGSMPGDALQLALDDIDTKLDNIDKTRRHFYANPDEVLDVDELVDVARDQLPGGETQFWISAGLALRTFGQIAQFYRDVLKETLLFGVGLATGESWVGLAIWGVQFARGAQGVQAGFEHAGLLRAMSNLDLTGDLQLATPDAAASAERWAWISLGFTVLDGCMFVRSATHMLRLSAVMTNSEVRMALQYTGRPVREIARDLGMSERRLVAELAAARGAARRELLERVRALQPMAPAWHSGAKLGESLSAESVAAETVQMELHPDYEFRLQAARDCGFQIEFTSGPPRVETVDILDEAGTFVRQQRSLYLQKRMRFLDLEHELGHIEQLERLGYPPMARKTELPTGALALSKNQSGIFRTEHDAVAEYHNRLSEFARLENKVPRSVLDAEYQGIQQYRVDAESYGFGRTDRNGTFNTLTRWAQQYFPEIPDLEQIVRNAGYELKPKTARWVVTP